MEFFDLSVPYHEKDALASGDADNATKKAARLKKVVKAMELGYTGVAYDRLFKGVMSDKDRCAIAPFPVSSLLNAAPTLAESVNFHRRLIGVPTSATFRQYRRMTVVLDSVVGASVLNSGNPVLKSYDIVAVRPTNQVAFEQACKAAEVDLISIDFSQKLSFRLKLPFVKAAIERGIYFEISYSQFISSAESRREVLPNAKMLVSWTRGKNLIISSAAPTVNEVRGPFDVVNLFSLFGLSTERAKEAISRNCRSLLASALRKKQCHKEAIRLESIPPGELKASGDLLSSWNSWDPISSGDGDLPSLDDFAKLFTNVTNESQKATRHHFSTERVVREKFSDEGNFLPGLGETSVDGGLSCLHTCSDEDRDKCLLVQPSSLKVLNCSSMDVDLSYAHPKDAMFSNEHDMDFKSSDMPDYQAVTLPKRLDQEDVTLRTCSVSVQDFHAEASLHEERDATTPITNFTSIKEKNDKSEAQKDLYLVTTAMPMEDMLNFERQKQDCGASESLLVDKHKSGKCRFMQKSKKKFSLLSHKGLLKPFLFKKIGRRLKRSRKHERR